MKADGKELACNEYISLKYKVAYNPNPNTTPPPPPAIKNNHNIIDWLKKDLYKKFIILFSKDMHVQVWFEKEGVNGVLNLNIIFI